MEKPIKNKQINKNKSNEYIKKIENRKQKILTNILIKIKTKNEITN